MHSTGLHALMGKDSTARNREREWEGQRGEGTGGEGR